MPIGRISRAFDPALFLPPPVPGVRPHRMEPVCVFGVLRRLSAFGGGLLSGGALPIPAPPVIKSIHILITQKKHKEKQARGRQTAKIPGLFHTFRCCFYKESRV